jgi:hypothetical protein
MTCDRLQIEKEKDDVAGIRSFQGKKAEIYRLQHAKSGLPKLVLIRLVVTYNGNYNALPYNYGNSLNIKGFTPVFYTKIDGLTQSGRFFTPKEIEK